MSHQVEPACRQMEQLDPFYKRVWERAFADCIPISGTFELTPRCNFNCKMCYVHLAPEQIHRYGRELTAREWLHLARQAREAGTTWLCITGGEPLLHPEFETIWRELAQMGFFLTLQTNASLLTQSVLQLLEEYPPRQVKITLYGVSNETYQAVCGVEDGFDRVNDGIHALMSAGIPVKLVTTFIRENYEERSEIAFYAYRHGLPWVSTVGVKSSQRGAETDIEQVRLLEQLEKHQQERIQRRMQDQHLLDPARKPCTYCRDYRLGYWVLWDGTISFCSFVPNTGISVRGLPFSEAWSRLLTYEEELDWPKKCKSCSAAEVCERCAATVAPLYEKVKKSELEECKKIQEYYAQMKRRDTNVYQR